jgi:hypothetical protein
MTLASVVLLSLGAAQAAQPAASDGSSADAFVRELTQSDWERVHSAKLGLESQQEAAVPALLVLMEDGRRIPLADTADLIYPGAKAFYGHGFIVDYDLDSLAIRAGWVLEEITFQDFGFRAGQIDHDALLRKALQGTADRPLSDVVNARPTEQERIEKAGAAAREWWKKAGREWSRLRGLQEALASPSPRRQMTALHYLRFGKTGCAGLDAKTYAGTLLPHVRRLAEAASDAVREQAAYLLREGWRRN